MATSFSRPEVGRRPSWDRCDADPAGRYVGAVGYELGVDVGAAVTVVAMHRAGSVHVVPVGADGAEVPSVLWLGENGEHLHGEAASQRRASDPERVSRAFIARVGDDTPFVMGGTPVSAERLMGLFVQSLVDDVVHIEGEPPRGLVVTHPAGWGDYRIELLAEAVRSTGLELLGLVPGPVAAALHHVSQSQVPDGAPIGVYDLGGTGFRASVVRSGHDGADLMGPAKSIARLGGHDFDHLLFEHVLALVDCDLSDLADTAESRSAVDRIRNDARRAKEALSLDSIATVPVALHDDVTKVRVARSEFERMIRPALAQTLVVFDQAIEAAGISASDLHTVLLVGGSSRIPLVSQVMSSHVVAPTQVAIDASPGHAMALGAATMAGRLGDRSATGPTALLTLRDAAGRTLEFDAGETIIGRRRNGDRCTVLDDPTVSARHAALVFDGHEAVVVDLGSTNGTWVNRRQVTRAGLTDGDVLEFGDHSVFTVDLGRRTRRPN